MCSLIIRQLYVAGPVAQRDLWIIYPAPEHNPVYVQTDVENNGSTDLFPEAMAV